MVQTHFKNIIDSYDPQKPRSNKPLRTFLQKTTHTRAYEQLFKNPNVNILARMMKNEVRKSLEA